MKTSLALCALMAVFYTFTAAPVSKNAKNQGLQPVPAPLTGQDGMKPPQPQPKPSTEGEEQDEDQESEEETSKPGKVPKPIPEEVEKQKPGTDKQDEDQESKEETETSPKETSKPGKVPKPIPEEVEKQKPETEDIGEEKETSEGGDEDEKEIDLSNLDSVDTKAAKGPQTDKEEDEEEEAELNPDLFEGDLKLSKDEIERIKGNTVSKKDGVASALRRWPNGEIPITRTKYFDRSRVTVLLQAIKQFHNKTCLRFVNKKPTHKNYIIFTKGGGCYSTKVGKDKNAAAQVISIGNGCNYIGTMIHEIMHAIGFFHEHTRTDRDQFITINWQNIEAKRETQFQKYGHGEGDYLGEPYDYDSVMHYPRTGFGVVVNGQPLSTIVPKDKPFRKIGQRNGFSSIDLRQINKMYKCTKFTSKY